MALSGCFCRFFDLYQKCGGQLQVSGQLKLKSPKQLQEVLDISRILLVEAKSRHDPELEDIQTKLIQLKAVLEMYGRFSGINRKVQLKYQPGGSPKSGEESAGEEGKQTLLPSIRHVNLLIQSSMLGDTL